MVFQRSSDIMKEGDFYMKEVLLKQESLAKLEEYGIQNIPKEYISCVLYDAGEKIIEEEQLITRLAVVIEGRAKICRTTPDGKNMILCYYLSEGTIGEIELFTGRKKAHSTVIAITDVKCICIDFQICRDELQKNIVFLNKLSNMLAHKVTDSSENYVASALCTGEQRLCSYILNNSHNHIFSEILTDAACSIGISYRHLFRLLERLCKENVLEKRINGYFVREKGELRRRSLQNVSSEH